MSVNKKDFMEFVSKAFDQGFRIDLSYFGDELTQKQAEKIGLEFASIIGQELKVTGTEKTTWFKAEANKLVCNIFHQDSDLKNADGYTLLYEYEIEEEVQ
jgi:hypothetical protein